MQAEPLWDLIAEIRSHLGGHAHLTIAGDEGVTSLVCNADEEHSSPEQLLVLAKLTSICGALEEGALGIVVRTMVLPDPDEDQPALCQIRGYNVTPDMWEKIPKAEMPQIYNVDSETGEELEPLPHVIFA